MAVLLLISLLMAWMAGCSKDYHIDFIFEGTIQEKLTEEAMLVVKEDGGEEKGRREGNVYEIPVDDIDKYNIGQKLRITVFSNTEADIWDVEHMKFEIEKIEP